jgi:hypothetical protein
MASEDDNNPSPPSQMGDAEMASLARRLRNRADSVYFRDQPSQAADLRAAASIIGANASLVRRLSHLQGELERAAAETSDDKTAEHLRRLLGGR